MQGILPDTVRTRTGKPDTGDVLLWSFAASQDHLRRLLEKPILADFGLIDPERLRAAFQDAGAPTRVRLNRHIGLYPTLAIEAWLQIRSGRWQHQGHLGRKWKGS
jgi:asparagine synthase (glutamine-hydrolysing)